MITQFNFAIGGGTQGTDITGALNDAAGIRIRILGGTLGTRGTVSYIQGTAFLLSTLFNEFLVSDGLLDTKVDSLTDLLDGVTASRVKLDERMEALEAQLIRQFTAADALIAQLRTTEDFLVQQLTLLNSLFTYNRR